MCLAFRFYSLLALLLFACQINAQILENHFYGNTVGADLLPGHLVATDDGGAVIAGKTNTPDTGGYQVLLIRTDSLGNVLWQRIYHQGVGEWVCKASDGGFIVGGSSDRHIFGSQKGFVMKVNDSGLEEWTEYLPYGDHSYVTDVEQLSSGDIAVCGVVVEEGTNASQKAFWAIFSDGGGLAKYETIDNAGRSYLPLIIEAKNGNLILAWSAVGSDFLRCFSPNGQMIWEQDLTVEFDYKFGANKSLLVDSIGDVWVVGGHKKNSNLYPYTPQVLHFSGNGNLKHRFSHEANNYGPTALYPGQNGKVHFWFPRYFGDYTGGLVKLTLSNQGTVLAKDSVVIDDYHLFQAVAKVNENRLLLLNYSTYLYRNTGIRVQPIQKSTTVYQVQDSWVFSSGLPFSHDLYESHCKSLSGGEFVLTRGDAKSDTFRYLGYYVLRISENNEELARTYLEEGDTYIGGQIQASTDGGAIALGRQGMAWKVDAQANLVWSKQAKSGELFAGPNNDFFIAESKSQPGIYDPIRIYHFNSQGDSVGVTNVYSRSQYFNFAGGVSQRGTGPMLFANKYDEPNQTWRNWLIYLDKEGEFVSEVLLDSSYTRTSSTNKIIQTSDGGTLIASHHYSTQGIYMMHLKDGEVLWSTNVFGSDPDSIYLELISIEEVPCKGYVLAFESNLIYTNTPSTKLMLLYYIDENGNGKDFYTYHPLLGPIHPDTDTSFLPGYTFRRWGYQLNGQTYDVLLQTVHFQDRSKVDLPLGDLTIMPNPSGDEICLHYESASYGLLDIEVFNAAGQRVDRFNSEKTGSEWLFHYHSNYPAGTYFIQIKNGDEERVVERWVKVR